MNLDTITKIVKASGVTAGELILIHFWGEDKDKAVANDFMTAVAACGASPILLQQSRSVNKDLFSAAQESCFDGRYFELLGHFDAVLDVFTYQPIVLGYEIEKEQFGYYRNYIS